MAKEITREELKESLRHYWRMRKWAKEQDPNEEPDIFMMEKDIEEYWYGNWCELCRNYIAISQTCLGCPLYENNEGCISPDDTVWNKMSLSETWGEWVKNATKMARVIMKLPREKP